MEYDLSTKMSQFVFVEFSEPGGTKVAIQVSKIRKVREITEGDGTVLWIDDGSPAGVKVVAELAHFLSKVAEDG